VKSKNHTVPANPPTENIDTTTSVQSDHNVILLDIAEMGTFPSSNQQLLDSPISPNSAAKCFTHEKEDSVTRQVVLTHINELNRRAEAEDKLRMAKTEW
jgi:hypothetical protein